MMTMNTMSSSLLYLNRGLGLPQVKGKKTWFYYTLIRSFLQSDTVTHSKLRIITEILIHGAIGKKNHPHYNSKYRLSF